MIRNRHIIHKTYAIFFIDYVDELDGVGFAGVEYFCSPFTTHSFMMIPLLGWQP